MSTFKWEDGGESNPHPQFHRKLCKPIHHRPHKFVFVTKVILPELRIILSRMP